MARGGRAGLPKAKKRERILKFKDKFKMTALRMNLSLIKAETRGGTTGVGGMSGQRGPCPGGLPAA